MQSATRDGVKTVGAGDGRPLDIWLSLVIVILILTFGGGLYLTAKAVLARIDAAELDYRNRQQQLQVEVFAVRKQLLDMDHMLRKLASAEPRAMAAGSQKPR
jgi:hypothetical protein